jgi:hypothetical protein
MAILVEEDSVLALEFPDGLGAGLEIIKLLLRKSNLRLVRGNGQADVDLPVIFFVPPFDQRFACCENVFKSNDHVAA